MGWHSDILQPSPVKGTPPSASHVQAFDAQGLTHACVQDGEERRHAFSAGDLRALHAASAESPERAAAHRWRWMLNSGKLPSLNRTMSEVDVQYMARQSMPLDRKGKGILLSRLWCTATWIPEPLCAGSRDVNFLA